MDSLLSIIAMLLSLFFPLEVEESYQSVPDSTEVTVVKVIDGDTIDVMLDGEINRVRYIGIDTPEPYAGTSSECFSLEASTRNEELVAGKKVTLVSDQENIDKYGRLLRYVYVDEVMVNEVLLEGGYATQLPIKPNTKYKSNFASLEAEARQGEKGLWSECK